MNDLTKIVLLRGVIGTLLEIDADDNKQIDEFQARLQSYPMPREKKETVLSALRALRNTA